MIVYYAWRGNFNLPTAVRVLIMTGFIVAFRAQNAPNCKETIRVYALLRLRNILLLAWVKYQRWKGHEILRIDASQKKRTNACAEKSYLESPRFRLNQVDDAYKFQNERDNWVATRGNSEKKLHKLVSKSRACHDNGATAWKLVEAGNLSQVTILIGKDERIMYCILHP